MATLSDISPIKRWGLLSPLKLARGYSEDRSDTLSDPGLTLARNPGPHGETLKLHGEGEEPSQASLIASPLIFQTRLDSPHGTRYQLKAT